MEKMIMRRLYIILILLVSFTTWTSAQVCYTDSLALTVTPSADSLAVFTPSSDSLPCILTGQGEYVRDTLYFTMFSQLNGFNIDSLTIDSINNLPPGLCWATNSPTNSFAGGQNGALLISGWVAAYPGQYKMVIYVSATTSFFTLPVTNLETSVGFRYYLRVVCPGGACPAIDTSGGKDSLFIPYPITCDAGIRVVPGQLSDMSVTPNPMTGSASVAFSSDAGGIFTMEMTDLLGETVSAKAISVSPGSNQLVIDRNGLNPGIYILSISGGNGTITSKVVVE